MRTYKVKVNGKTYLVEVEEVGSEERGRVPEGTGGKKDGEAMPASDMERIEAPMQGTLTAMRVAPGERVRQGQVVAVLDAMKMENDLASPVEGTVSEVHARAGDTLDSGALILTIRTK